MAHRPYPNADRALRQLGRRPPEYVEGEYRLSTRAGEHDFQYGDDHVYGCTRCGHPHAQWSGGPCPGMPQDWGPGRFV